ncbi:MAG: hypothetical protein J7518_21170 [Nocardioidaceae bacterium]|nr:hypothetical protein [Nocardioidaceae bacterium]
MFWSIVLAVLAVVLLLGWLHDRRRKGHLRRVGSPDDDPAMTTAKAEFQLRQLRGSDPGQGG